jgi:hypothetical protein
MRRENKYFTFDLELVFRRKSDCHHGMVVYIEY